MSGQNFRFASTQTGTPIFWQGGSGHAYSARPLSVEHFILNEDHIYLLVNAGQATWVGTARDLVDDQISRSQFRRAINAATSAFELNLPRDEHQRLSLIADLETGHPLHRLSAA